MIINMLDTIKVTSAAMIGFITQMTNVDLVFKCIIGLLTIIYLGMKICDWIKGRKNND